MTSIVSGGGSSANYQTYDDVQLQQATKTLDVPKDTIDNVAGTNSLNNSYIEAYLNPPSKIDLPAPTGNQAATMEQVTSGLQQLRQNLMNKDKASEKAVTSYLTDQKVYYEATESQINNLTDQQLQNIAYQPGMTNEAIREEVLFAVLHPEADVPDEVREIANQIQTSALASARETLGAGWEPASMAWVQDTGIMLAVQSYFDETVAGMPDLSKDDIVELRFAMENPDAVDSLSSRLKDIFEQVIGKVRTQAQMNFGIPDSWQFPEDRSSPVGLTTAFDHAFEKAIQTLVENKKIDEMEARQLETLHYHPDADIPNAGKLKDKLEKIEDGVLHKLQKDWGFPEGYRPPTGADNREAMLNMVYQRNFDKALNKFNPPLTAEQKALIRASQGLTGASSLPPGLQKIADAIKGGAMSEVIEAYGLPSDWAPMAIAIADRSSIAPNQKLITSLMNHANEIANIGKKHVESMPEGDIKNTYMVFLSIVASALSHYAEVLTQSQVVQADMGKVLTQTRLDMELNKIATQKRQLEEQKKAQEGKGGFGGFLMNLITWVINIVLVVVTLGAAIALIVDAAQHGKDMASLNLINYAFEVANRVLGKPLGSWMLIIGYIMALIFAISISMFCPIVLMVLVAIVTVDLYVGNGDIVTQCLMACGIPETAAMVMSMIICMVYSIIVDILITVLMAFIPVGGEAGMVALWSAKIAMYTAKIVAAVVKAVITVINAMGRIGKIIMTVVKFIIKCLEMLAKLVAELVKTILNQVAKMTARMEKLAQLIAKGVGKVATEIGKETGMSAAKAAVKQGIKEGVEKAGRELAKTVVGKVVKESAEKFAETSVGKLSKSVGKWAVKEAKSQWNDLFDINIVGDLKSCEKNFDDYCKGVKNSWGKAKELGSGDSTHWEQKFEKLERLQKAVKEFKAAEKRLDEADKVTSTVKDAKLARQEFQRAKDEFTASAVDYKRFDENLNPNGWDNLQTWKKTKDQENKILERADMTDGLSERKTYVEEEYQRRLEGILGEKRGPKTVEVDRDGWNELQNWKKAQDQEHKIYDRADMLEGLGDKKNAVEREYDKRLDELLSKSTSKENRVKVDVEQKMKPEDYIRETMPETYYYMNMIDKEGAVRRAKSAKSIGRKGLADMDEKSMNRLESIENTQSAFNDMKMAEKARDDAKIGKVGSQPGAGDAEDLGGDGATVGSRSADEGISGAPVSDSAKLSKTLKDKAGDALTEQVDKEYAEAREKFNKALKKLNLQIGKEDREKLKLIEERKMGRIQDNFETVKSNGLDTLKDNIEMRDKIKADNKAYNDEIESFLGGLKDEAMQLSKEDAKLTKDAAKQAMEEAVAEYEKHVTNELLLFYDKVKTTINGTFSAIQGLQGVETNYLAGKLAMMKASADAYITEIDFALKALKDMISRLMESVSSLGEDISEIGKLIKSLYASNSQTMSTLSMAA